MSTIPSTGVTGIDIAIAILAGGAVTTWLTLVFNRLAARRAEYIDISKDKIQRISKSEIIYMHLGSYLGGISSKLRHRKGMEEPDYQECIFHIAKYLFEYKKFFRDVAYIQLDDIYAEEVLTNLVQYLLLALLEEKNIGRTKVSSLPNFVSEETGLQEFVNSLDLNLPFFTERRSVFEAYKKWLKNLSDDDVEKICERAEWYSHIIALELNIRFRIYYGGMNYIKKYTRDRPLYPKLIEYLATEFPLYFRRLQKLGIF